MWIEGGGAGGPGAVRFAALVRAVSTEARRLGLTVPGFRSPPRLVGVDRSLRRREGGTPSVAVRLAGRTDDAVAADLVDGVLAANRVDGPPRHASAGVARRPRPPDGPGGLIAGRAPTVRGPAGVVERQTRPS